MVSGARQRLVVAGAAWAVAFAAATGASAEQFVVAVTTYTHSAQTTKDSHFRVDPTPETPADWSSPVDYAGGSVHVRLEVKTKPSSTPTRYQICFEMKQNYCCTDQAPAYTAPGIYEWDTSVEDMWRPGPVNFAQGILRSALILKDTNNVKPAPENVGEETSELYMPTDLSVTVTVVAAGDTFVPPVDPNEPVGGSGGGGAGGVAGALSAAGMGGAGSAGAGGNGGAPPAMMPEPTGGTDGSDPSASAGTAPAASGAAAPVAANGDDASCSASQSPRGATSQLATLAGLALLILRARRKA